MLMLVTHSDAATTNADTLKQKYMPRKWSSDRIGTSGLGKHMKKKVGITTPATRELRKTLQMVSIQGSARGGSSVIGFETGVVLHLPSGG